VCAGQRVLADRARTAPTHKGSYTPFGLASSLMGEAGDVLAPAATGLPLGYLAAFALIVRTTRCLT
jgi:hypothetical protein